MRLRSRLMWRVIPACAGWTLSPGTKFTAAPGYPRLRGVDLAQAELQSDADGLSPRARGGQLSLLIGERAARVIPACAGWTSVCYSSKRTLSGLSPLARGGRGTIYALDRATAGYPRLRGVDTISSYLFIKQIFGPGKTTELRHY